ncbi:hypothetical protein H0H81_011832 [Sphagnurus paluster]|uniref:Uncharacterized protein n=1 Tax=Sphagnurus paluster TaxID=117069 RepID=A0A9P7KKF1_9AGAR|nr:hypothetical protein H0H81_011832 [Sphagnurus paluster]
MGIASIYESGPTDLKTILELFIKAYPTAYKTLTLGEPLVCSARGNVLEAAPPPTAIFFGLSTLKATRALTGRSVPVISWVSTGSAAFLRLWGPESMGGLDDFGAKVDAEVARTGKSPLEAGEYLYRHTKGAVIRIPGLPPMYDHEFQPQKLPMLLPLSVVIMDSREFLLGSDAVIIAPSDAYEKETLHAVRDWIVWPFDGDQPLAAVYLEEILKVAFELIEVRTGLGPGPIYRNGKTPKGTREAVGEEIRRVLDDCLGEEGEALSNNALRLKVQFAQAWEEGGVAKLAIRAFLKKFT